MELVGALHVRDLLAPDVDPGEVVAADARPLAVAEIAHPVRVDAHAVDPHPVGGHVVGGGDGDPRRHGEARVRAVAFHSLEAVDHRRAPEGAHALRGEHDVVVHLADAHVVAALVAPARALLRPAPERRAEGHVLDREGGHHRVVRLQGGGADDVSVLVQEPGGQAHRGQVQVVVEDLERLVAPLVVEVHEADVTLAALGGDLRVSELLVGAPCVAGGGLGDDDRPLPPRAQEVEDAVDGVGVGRGELLDRRDEVRLDDHVLLLPENGQDPVLDEGQGLGHVLPAVVAPDERDDTLRRRRIPGPQEPWRRRERPRGRPSEPQESPSRQVGRHSHPLRPILRRDDDISRRPLGGSGRRRALPRSRLPGPRLDAAGPRAPLRPRDALRLHERQLRGLLRLRVHAHAGRDLRERGRGPARDRRLGDGRPGPFLGLLRHEPRPAVSRRGDRLRRPGAAPPGHLREGPPLRRDRGEPGQGPPAGPPGLRGRPRGQGSRRRARAGCGSVVPAGGAGAGLDPARAGERPRASHAEERLHGAVPGGPRLRRARGDPGGGGGHDGEAAGPLRRFVADERARGRGLHGSGPVPRPPARLSRGRAGGRRRQRRRGCGPLGPREGARGPAALGPQANSVWARESRRATATPCGQRTAHSAQSPQRTSRCATGRARKCSRPRANCPYPSA